MSSRPSTAALLAAVLVAPTGGGRTSCAFATDSDGRLFVSVRVNHFTDAGVDCWELRAADGRRYEARREQAPDGLFQDGASASLQVRERPDVAARCPGAMVVDVEAVESVRPAAAG